jgi:YD repeat-containing protein
MMKKTIFFLIAALSVQTRLHAQATYAELENNKIVYPSPTAGSLGKYGEYPVSLYNGLVNIGQDIVTVQSGHLALNVSLSYHASGNRPSDIPGWVGLGFSLNAGGVITRVIKDLPDDLTGGFYAYNTTVKYYWDNFPNTHFVEKYFSGDVDPRSDVYQFNFCGKTGEFVFDMDRNIHFKQKVPFKIEPLGILGGFAGFKVTTDDGTIYTFGQTERSIRTQPLGPTNEPPTSWYLTKIENLSGDLIELKYTTPNSKYRYKKYGSRKEVAGYFYDPAQAELGDPLVTGPTITLNNSVDEVVYLDEIDFNNGKLLFGKSTRLDPTYMPGGITSTNIEEKKLDLITLKDGNDNVVKKWKFEYFENSTERLKLKNLIVQGSDLADVQKYSFEYNFLKFPLPPTGAVGEDPYFTNDVDYWGYYNGAVNGDNKIPKMYISELGVFSGSAYRSVNPLLGKMEMLEKINYPTGGYAQFDFESNDYSAQGESFAADQNPLFESGTPPESFEFSYDREEGGFDTDPSTLTFTVTESTHIYTKYSSAADGPAHGLGNPGQIYEFDYWTPAGTYTMADLFLTANLSLPANADITRAHFFATVYKIGPPVAIIAKPGPGMRIKSIVTSDGITTTTRSFEYKQVGTAVSSGYLSVFPAFGTSLQRFASNIYGTYIASDPINDVGEGAPIGYSRVVERFQDNSYIVHNYTTYGDHPDDNMPFTNPVSDYRLAHKSSNDFLRGLETNTDYFNTAGVLQKRTMNNYEVLTGSLTEVPSIELKPTVSILDFSSQVNNVNGTLTSFYNVHSCFLYNTTRTEQLFDKDGLHPVTTSTTKYYDNLQHLQPSRIQVTGSDGSVLTTATSFPDDYARGTAFINYLQDNHFTAYPVEQVAYREKGGVNNIVSGDIITYKTTGAALADQLLKLETASPVSLAAFKFSNRATGVLPPSSTPAAFDPDAHYKTAVTYSLYDTKGNLLELTKRNGIKTAYVWGYKQQMPVAEVVGSGYAAALALVTPSVFDNPSSDAPVRTELNKIRTGLPGAMVTTYTYKPLIGTTSQVDPSGKVVYYEYDPFGRLKLMRDQNNAILKKFDYKYNGQ